ncbi:phage portal protein, partial [Agrobacterium sp. S2]|nr:phage portal protein [Agrobacterium sp. S2]
MRFPFSLPRKRPADGNAMPENRKMAGGFMAVAMQGGQAFWSGRSYAALAREGFMKNPVAHRAARMVAEAAASVNWLLYDGDDEIGDHPLLALLARPGAHMGGPDFFEALYGH